jgi:transcriptional regulator with XRE-family HTH domain
VPEITSRQIRAARALVDLSQAELAKAAEVSRSHIADIENEKTNPTPELMSRIRKVLENSRVEFLLQDGVRLLNPLLAQDDRPGANKRLLDDIYLVASQFKLRGNTSDILIFGVQEEDAQNSVGHYLTDHLERLKLAGLHEKILCGPNTHTFVAPRSSYRRLPRLDPSQNPICIYGDKIAVVHWSPKEFVITITSEPIASAFRAMFYLIWDAQRGIEDNNP